MPETRGCVTIVPGGEPGGRYLPTRGTRVLMPDGTPVPGVKRIELIANTNDIWRAKIELVASVREVSGVHAVLEHGRKLNWLRRLLLRLAGASTVDVTDLGSTEMQFERVKLRSVA